MTWESKNLQGSLTWNLPASFVRCYFSPVKTQVSLCVILVWVPLGWWIPVQSCVLELFCKLHFWQRWEAQCFLISIREAEAALFYTHRKPNSSSGWDSSWHFKRPEIFTGCWWKRPSWAWWWVKRISKRTLHHKHLLLFLLLPHIYSIPINIFLQKIYPGWLRKILVRAVYLGALRHWKRMRSAFIVISHCYRKSPDHQLRSEHFRGC